MSFSSRSVVWTKCGSHFWPAVVQDEDELEEDVKQALESEKKRPKIVVKFLDEDGYEFLYNEKNVFPYECERKSEFIRKGLVRSRSEARNSNSWFNKFPHDVVRCESMMDNGDPHILEKEPYLSIMGTQKTNESQNESKKSTPTGKRGRGRPRKSQTTNKSHKNEIVENNDEDNKMNNSSIVHPRFVSGVVGPGHSVKILPQPSTPHIDVIEESKKESSNETANNSSSSSPIKNANSPSFSVDNSGGKYTCPICGKSASRLNVVLMCTKACKQQQSTPKSSGRGAKRGGGRAVSRDVKNNRKRARTSGTTAASSSTPTRSTPKDAKRPKKASSVSKTTTTATPKTNKITKKPASAKPSIDVRATILNDWFEEENESEERSKSNDSDDEEEQSFMMDDNVRGNEFEDNDDDVNERNAMSEENAKKKNVTPDNGSSNTTSEPKQKANTEKEDEIQEDESNSSSNKPLSNTNVGSVSVACEKKEKETTVETGEKVESESNGESSSKNETNKPEGLSNFDFDIGKVLEETKVPELPSSMVSELRSNKRKSARKSVSFSEQVRELRSKKMRIVQPVSNLEVPPHVDDDEFDEFFNAKATPGVVMSPINSFGGRKILKKISANASEEEKAAKNNSPNIATKEIRRAKETNEDVVVLETGNGSKDKKDTNTSDGVGSKEICDVQTNTNEEKDEAGFRASVTEGVEAPMIGAITATVTEPVESSVPEAVETTVDKIIGAPVTEVFESSVTDTFESSVAEALEASVTDAIEATATEAVEAPVTDAAESSVTYAVEAPVNEAVEAPVAESVEPTVKETMRALANGAPVIEDAEAPITENVEAPVTEDAEAPITENAEAPVTEDAEAPVTEDAEAPVTEDSEALITENAEAPVSEDAEAIEAPVTDTEKAPVSEAVESPVNGTVASSLTNAVSKIGNANEKLEEDGSVKSNSLSDATMPLELVEEDISKNRDHFQAETKLEETKALYQTGNNVVNSHGTQNDGHTSTQQCENKGPTDAVDIIEEENSAVNPTIQAGTQSVSFQAEMADVECSGFPGGEYEELETNTASSHRYQERKTSETGGVDNGDTGKDTRDDSGSKDTMLEPEDSSQPHLKSVLNQVNLIDPMTEALLLRNPQTEDQGESLEATTLKNAEAADEEAGMTEAPALLSNNQSYFVDTQSVNTPSLSEGQPFCATSTHLETSSASVLNSLDIDEDGLLQVQNEGQQQQQES